MRKEDKSIVIAEIKAILAAYPHLYLADIGGLNAAQTSALRRSCNKENIRLVVVKNTLLQKAMEASEVDYSQLYAVLKGETSLMLSETGNAPARLIKNFSKDNPLKKPALKAAYVEEAFYVGENHLDELVNIKSKNELIGDLVALLQSPLRNVVSALQSGGNTIHGILETLGDR